MCMKIRSHYRHGQTFKRQKGCIGYVDENVTSSNSKTTFVKASSILPNNVLPSVKLKCYV